MIGLLQVWAAGSVLMLIFLGLIVTHPMRRDALIYHIDMLILKKAREQGPEAEQYAEEEIEFRRNVTLVVLSIVYIVFWPLGVALLLKAAYDRNRGN